MLFEVEHWMNSVPAASKAAPDGSHGMPEKVDTLVNAPPVTGTR